MMRGRRLILVRASESRISTSYRVGGSAAW